MTRIERQLATAKLHYDNLVHTAETGQRWLSAEQPQILKVLKSYGLNVADFDSNRWVEQGVLDNSEYYYRVYIKCAAGQLTARRRQNLQTKLRRVGDFRVSFIREDGFEISKRII